MLLFISNWLIFPQMYRGLGSLLSAHSMIGYWHDTVVCLSVMLCAVALQQVSEQVNRKCPLETRFYNFQPPTLTLSPQTPRFLHYNIGVIWRIQ